MTAAVDAEAVARHFGRRLEPVAFPPGFRLPDGARELLERHGLPTAAALRLRFSPGAARVRATGGGRALVVGSDGGTELALVEGSGALVALDPGSGERVRLVSSSAPLFLEFLRLYEGRLPALREASDEDGAVIARELREVFARLDPPALDGEDAWWSLVLEQTEQGLL